MGEEGSSLVVTGPRHITKRLTLRELCGSFQLTWNLGCVSAVTSNKMLAFNILLLFMFSIGI